MLGRLLVPCPVCTSDLLFLYLMLTIYLPQQCGIELGGRELFPEHLAPVQKGQGGHSPERRTIDQPGDLMFFKEAETVILSWNMLL